MALPGIVLASSLAAHAKADRPVVLHLLHTPGRIELNQELARLEHAAFRCIRHDMGSAFAGLKVHEPYTAAIFSRLCLPDLLPDISRVIYLDADTITLRDLSDLYDQPLDGLALAAMPDYPLFYFELLSPVPVGARRKPVLFYLKEVLNIDYSEPPDYFNSGVMLLDLDVWRSNHIARRCIEFVRQTDHPLQWPDQDAVNVVCNKAYLPLDPRWNAFASGCTRVSRLGISPELTALQEIWHADPWIVHYSGDYQPWNPAHKLTVHHNLFWRQSLASSSGRHLLRIHIAHRTKTALKHLRRRIRAMRFRFTNRA